jgi:hypothetical protein
LTSRDNLGRQPFSEPSLTGSLRFPPAALLDISGQKLLDLHEGASDVSRLVPGVYFIRDQVVAGATTRVLIVR